MGAGHSGGVEIAGSPMGYQVLRVYPNSPGSCAGLKAYFDFIVAIGNTRFNKENGSLREILKASVDQKLKMVVYNTRTKSVREVEIVPSSSWGGNGLLGVSIKHSSFDRADERVWHVVEVEPGSPAQQAGFKANEDYVIGSDSILQENDDLYNLIEAHEGKALKLFVYNVNQDNCREVICHPNSKWGGKGYLGCEFGHGLLHRIPCGDVVHRSPEDSSRAPLLRNEQQPAVQEPSLMPPQQANRPTVQHHQQVTNQTPSNNAFSFQQLQQMQQSPWPSQPGNQLFQQALGSAPKPHQPPQAEQYNGQQPAPPMGSALSFQTLQQQHQQLQQQHQQLQQQYQQQQLLQQQQPTPPPPQQTSSPQALDQQASPPPPPPPVPQPQQTEQQPAQQPQQPTTDKPLSFQALLQQPVQPPPYVPFVQQPGPPSSGPALAFESLPQQVQQQQPQHYSYPPPPPPPPQQPLETAPQPVQPHQHQAPQKSPANPSTGPASHYMQATDPYVSQPPFMPGGL